MIAFFANPIAKYVTAALAAVLVFGGAYIKGRMDGKSLMEVKVAEQKAEWQKEVAGQQRTLEKQISDLRLQYEKETSQYRKEIANLKNNPTVITRWVPKETSCTIPKGFVDLHNRAADGVSLDNVPADVATNSNKTLADVGSIVAENYYQCNTIISRLETLQQLVKEFQKKQKELTK